MDTKRRGNLIELDVETTHHDSHRSRHKVQVFDTEQIYIYIDGKIFRQSYQGGDEVWRYNEVDLELVTLALNVGAQK